MNYRSILVGIVICLVVEFLVFTINHKYNFFTPVFLLNNSNIQEKREGGDTFTNPLLECSDPEDGGIIKELHISKEELNNYVSQILAEKKVSTISVYIRDLNNGPWFGINSSDKFIGGSLLKVPLLISYLKLSDSDPTILNKSIKYDKKIADNRQYFRPQKEIEVGKTYTVGDLLNYMINYSDNNAAELLFENLGERGLDSTFEALGFGKPDVDQPYPVDSVTYASFFRILYNSSYLSRASSEKALKILSQTDFNYGLTAPLPNNIVVSHKFGIRTDGDVNQLHDCGIVYYPGHPYLVCIMTRGGTFDDLASTISRLSKFIYDQVDQNQSLTQ
jgi:beta-lactamase class A